MDYGRKEILWGVHRQRQLRMETRASSKLEAAGRVPWSSAGEVYGTSCLEGRHFYNGSIVCTRRDFEGEIVGHIISLNIGSTSAEGELKAKR
jgi:hypothetical protein